MDAPDLRGVDPADAAADADEARRLWASLDELPDDMAGTAIYLSSRAGSYLTGAIIPVDGGVSTR